MLARARIRREGVESSAVDLDFEFSQGTA